MKYEEADRSVRVPAFAIAITMVSCAKKEEPVKPAEPDEKPGEAKSAERAPEKK